MAGKRAKVIVLTGADPHKAEIAKKIKRRLARIGYKKKVALLGCGMRRNQFRMNARDRRSDAVFHLRWPHPLDQKMLEVWVGHRHLRVIPVSLSKPDRINFLWRHIKRVLGIPKPLEVERRFLVEAPDGRLSVRCGEFRVVQNYLRQRSDGSWPRIRMVSDLDRPTQRMFFETIKKRVSAMTREEIERRLDEGEYKKLRRKIDPAAATIVKKRSCFVYADQYFELDEFLEPYDNLALMEIELLEEDDEVLLPPFIGIIKEVTGDSRYNSSHLARMSLGQRSHLKNYP